MDEKSFQDFLKDLAEAWNKGETEKALGFFTLDALYMQPPGIYIFQGYDQLNVLFSSLTPGDNFSWHSIWFNSGTQSGAGEFTFRVNNAHGVAVIETDHGKIKLWREYQWQGNLPWEQFISVNRSFQLTINNFDAES